MKRSVPHYQRGVPFALGSAETPPERAPDALGALAALRAVAAAGSAEAAVLVGRILLSTRGCEHEGATWLRAAADAGDASALHLLGLAHFRGQGVTQDLTRARELQLQAAARGNVDAQFELALLLAQGVGGKRDARGAARWEAKAADAGHPRACLNRGARLASQKKPDYRAAVSWYERAAAGGSDEAAARLCQMYLVGQGVRRNEATARRWFARAAELGYDWAAEARK